MSWKPASLIHLHSVTHSSLTLSLSPIPSPTRNVCSLSNSCSSHLRCPLLSNGNSHLPRGQDKESPNKVTEGQMGWLGLTLSGLPLHSQILGSLGSGLLQGSLGQRWLFVKYDTKNYSTPSHRLANKTGVYFLSSYLPRGMGWTSTRQRGSGVTGR